MGRGFFSGVIWGSLLAVVALSLVSQMGGMMTALSGSSTNSEIISSDVISTEKISAENNSAETIVPETIVPETMVPEIVAEPVPVVEAVQPDAAAPAPQTTAEASDLSQPATGETSNVELALVTPPKPVAGTAAPKAPADEVAPSVSLAIPAPDIPEAIAALGVAPETTQGVILNPADATTAPLVAEPERPAAPMAETVPAVDFSQPQEVILVAPEVAVATPEPEPAPELVPEPEPVPAPQVAPKFTPEPTPEPTPAPTPDPTPAPAAPEVDTKVAEAEQTETAILKPVVGLGKQSTEGKSSRFQTIGESTREAATEPETEAEVAEGADDAALADAPAIERYAVAFENQGKRPLMAILLLVDPSMGSAGVPLPFPVTYVVDASAPNAGDVMRRFRDAGNEVVALAPLAANSTPADVEVSFQSYLSAIPEAVAVMDTPEAMFQSGRSVATQVAEALKASGHGLISYSRGLNSGMQIAETEGVPAALVFREIDDGGKDKAAIQRFLDQAAFRAGQQEGVILVGHNRPETIAALMEWSLGNRANTVALAPISVALQGK